MTQKNLESVSPNDVDINVNGSRDGVQSVPLCKDCEFFRCSLLDASAFSKCYARVRLSPPNLVTGGAVKTSPDSCDISRGHAYMCGKSGRLFKPRKTIWQKLTALFRKTGGA